MTTTLIVQHYDGGVYYWHIYNGVMYRLTPYYIMAWAVSMFAILCMGILYYEAHKEINAGIRSLFRKSK